MVKAAGFIEGMAEVMGLPVETVRVAYRALRTEGLLTTGARGVNAPDMIAIDAARMLIWGMVSDRPIDAVNAVRDFGSIPLQKTFDRENTLPQYNHDLFPRALPLEMALVVILTNVVTEEDYANDFEVAELEIQSSDLIATLVIDGTGYEFSYSITDLVDESSDNELKRVKPEYFDLRKQYERKIKQIRTIETAEFQEIADLIASR